MVGVGTELVLVEEHWKSHEGTERERERERERETANERSGCLSSSLNLKVVSCGQMTLNVDLNPGRHLAGAP